MKRSLPLLLTLIVGLALGAALQDARQVRTKPPRGDSPLAVGDPIKLSCHGPGVESQFHRLKVARVMGDKPSGVSDGKEAEWYVIVGSGDDAQVYVLTRE